MHGGRQLHSSGDVIGRNGMGCLGTGLSMMYYEFCAYPMKLVS